MPSLSRTSILSLTGVLLSTFLLQVLSYNNHNTGEHGFSNQATPLSIYVLAWLISVFCHYHSYISDTAARILICQMGAVHANMWKQWYLGAEQTAAQYLVSSLWCAHLGMFAALIWKWSAEVRPNAIEVKSNT